MSITVRCSNATSIYCLIASKGVWHDCSCWRKSEGIVCLGWVLLRGLWSHHHVVFSVTWSCTGGTVQLLSPQMQSRHYPHAFCGFGLPFGLANLPSETVSIIRCIWVSLCLSRWETAATRTQCCVIQQRAVTAPWRWLAFTLLVHQCPHILLAGFALTSLK